MPFEGTYIRTCGRCMKITVRKLCIPSTSLSSDVVGKFVRYGPKRSRMASTWKGFDYTLAFYGINPLIMAFLLYKIWLALLDELELNLCASYASPRKFWAWHFSKSLPNQQKPVPIWKIRVRGLRTMVLAGSTMIQTAKSENLKAVLWYLYLIMISA